MSLTNLFPRIRMISDIVLIINKRYAGHSKWSNIKHIKAAKDKERAQIMQKIGQKIKVAIQEGGSANPNNNIHLAQVISVAKKNSVPLATINNYIQLTQNDKSKGQNIWYEIRGPNGCAIVVLAHTQYPKKTRDNLATIMRKSCGMFGNSIKNSFDHKGVVIAKPPADLINTPDAIVDHAIEVGAEEVNPLEADGLYEFMCELKELKIVQSKLESLNYTIESAEYDLVPRERISLNDEQSQLVSKLTEKLGDHPDVVEIYDNIA